MNKSKYQYWKDMGVKYGGSPDIVLPNGYLSYTSINKLGTTNDWIEHYIKDRKKDLSSLRFIKAGKELSEKREFDIEYHNKYPSLAVKEGKHIVPIKLTGSDLRACLVLKPDSATEDLTHIMDDKMQDINSNSPWTQAKVYNWLQFRLYALAVYELTGKIPQITVCVIYGDKGVETGEHQLYTVKYSFGVIEDTRRVFTKAVVKANQLTELFKEELCLSPYSPTSKEPSTTTGQDSSSMQLQVQESPGFSSVSSKSTSRKARSSSAQKTHESSG